MRSATGHRRPRSPLTGRWALELGLQEFEVPGVVLGEYLCPRSHVCPRQLVGRSVEGAKFELALPKSEMQEWIANRIGIVHRTGQVVATCFEVTG